MLGAALTLDGCVPAAYAGWEVKTSDANLEGDFRRVTSLLMALGFEGPEGEIVRRRRYVESFHLGNRAPINIEVVSNAAATTKSLSLSEMFERRLSQRGNKHVDTIDAAPESEFGRERVKMTSRHLS